MTNREWLESGLHCAAIGVGAVSFIRSCLGEWVIDRGVGRAARRWFFKVSQLLGSCFIHRGPAMVPVLVSKGSEIQRTRSIQAFKADSVATRTRTDAYAYTVLALSALLVVFLLTFTTQSLAQTLIVSVPENAHPKKYGDGWECDLSFRVSGDLCVAIVVPENAYPTNRAYGNGWDCQHGFEEAKNASCIKVFVPAGGYLNQSGRGWNCLRGYTKVDDTCSQITLPANAYLLDDRYGPGWKCERGYTKTSDQCLAIIVPENAFLNTAGYGQPWSCERGFFEAEGACEAVIVPANAYLDDASYGPGWKCERGFAATDNACTAMTLPQNAHLDRSGNRWECNLQFWRSKGLCVIRK